MTLETKEDETMSEKSAHAGHRERLRKRIAQNGVKSLSDDELLEFLLFYVIPRRDTHALARRLIEQFGSLSNVLSASCRELEKAGLSKQTAFWVGNILDLADVICKYETPKRKEVPPDDVIMHRAEEIVKKECGSLEPGMILVVVLNSFGDLVNVTSFADRSDVVKNVGLVCEAADVDDAFFVILANKYEDDLSPSEFECCMTSTYRDALRDRALLLLDRFHVTKYNFSSYRKTGAFFNTKEEFYTSLYYRLMYQK